MGDARIWQSRPWGCPWGYLEGEPLDVYHLPKPAQGRVDELQHRQEGNEVGRNVGHEPHGGSSPVARSFQDVLLLPVWKKTPMGSRGRASPVQGLLSLRGCLHTTGSPNLGPPAMSTCAPKLPPRLACTGRTRAAPLHHPSPCTHPRERRILALPLNLDSSTSG